MPKTRDLATLSCLCSCAVSWDYIDISPVKQFSERHIRKSPPRTTYPTTAQVDQLVANAPVMAGQVIRFLAETRMWQEDVCGLEWSQGVDPAARGQVDQDQDLQPTGGPGFSGAAIGHWSAHPGTSPRLTSSGTTTACGIPPSPPAMSRSPAGPECRSAATTCATPLPAGSYRPRATSQPFRRSLAIDSITDDHAVRPHDHQPPPPGDGRFRRQDRHKRNGIYRHRDADLPAVIERKRKTNNLNSARSRLASIDY